MANSDDSFLGGSLIFYMLLLTGVGIKFCWPYSPTGNWFGGVAMGVAIMQAFARSRRGK